MTGILLMLAAMLVMPFLDVAAKLLGQQNMPVMESVWARFFCGTLLNLPLVLKNRAVRELKTDIPVTHTVRAALVIASTAFFFLAMYYLPIADTLAIFFVQPLAVTLLSPVILKEQVGLRRWIAVVIGFIGTLIIIRPGFQVLNEGVVLALLSGTTSALYIILTRRISGRTDPIVTMFHTNVAGPIITTLMVGFFWVTPSLEQWGLMLIIAFVAFIGHYLVIAAYHYAEASLLAPMAYAEMIMAVVCGWWFFGDLPDRWTFTGVGILIACAIYISYRERVRGIPVEPSPPQP
ncbi:DMT family transporter [Nordella sp. HKS 07]|uniref:DMT family transporter n=1 Tax=Nordella sp. HKS 07 TaxID=2712222 RepID=UPI0013E19453|nr:DMT family transporter [Nordella sp. HKS 07]QIG50706.1 DMT family transporter [Nordella sp. HKS 07]